MTPKQKVGLVSQYRDMAFMRLNRLSKMMIETAECFEDPNMGEYLPRDMSSAAEVLKMDAKTYSEMATALGKPQADKAMERYDHGSAIHQRNQLREALKKAAD